jgi:hypothetical protein
MNRLLGLILVLVLGIATAGCGEKVAETHSFVNTPDVSAVLGLPDGGLRFATAKGEVFDAGADGKRVETPLTTIAGVASGGVLSLVADKDNRTFASYVDAGSQKLVVAQIAPGPQRAIFRSAEPATAHPVGRMSISAENRIVIAFNPDAAPGRILSIDPDRNDDQQSNVISSNWQSVRGVAYAAGRVLWGVDSPDTEGDLIARVGPEGPTGKVTHLSGSREPSALVPYGDSELVACFAKTGTLQRFSIVDGTQAMEGRTLAKDCSGAASALRDGRVAYVAGGEIRVTAV